MKSDLSVCAAALLLLVACSSSADAPAKEATQAPAATPRDQARPAPGIDAAVVAPTFQRFVLKSYHWELGGYEMLIVNREGPASYVGPVPRRTRMKGEVVIVSEWSRVDWQPETAQVDALIAELETMNFRELDELYINRNIEDGQSVEFTLVDDTGPKKVTCSNEFPDAIQKLRLLLRTEFTGPQQGPLKKAKVLSNEDAEAYWKQY